MRAAGRTALLTALASLIAGGARALPPPPYAAGDPGQGQMQGQGQNQPMPAVGSAPVIDRYGGYHRAAPPLAPPAMQPDARYSAPGSFLAWSGKAEMQAPVAQAAPRFAPQIAPPIASRAAWSAQPRRWDAVPPVQPGPPVQRQAQAATRENGWRPLYAAPNLAPAPAPTSIYDAPPTTEARAPGAAVQPPAPYRQAQANSGRQTGPHFYSLHREYGIQPDAIPLPPQFFGPTADLSTPATDPVVRRTTTINGQTRTVNVPDDQSAP